jgi:hypothetical protein
MSIIIKKSIKDVYPEAAVTFKKDLPKIDNKVNDIRFVKSEYIFYIFNGFIWQELDLVIE